MCVKAQRRQPTVQTCKNWRLLNHTEHGRHINKSRAVGLPFWLLCIHSTGSATITNNNRTFRVGNSNPFRACPLVLLYIALAVASSLAKGTGVGGSSGNQHKLAPFFNFQILKLLSLADTRQSTPPRLRLLDNNLICDHRFVNQTRAEFQVYVFS